MYDFSLMPCWYPLQGYRAAKPNENGKRPLVFKKKEGNVDRPMTVSCGQCTGCRLERSRQWAIRSHHETTLHKDNCFITLTYDDEFLPDNYSLHRPHFQAFAKALRHSCDSKIKIMYCGEYGDQYRRPHFHAIIYNLDFQDRKLWKNHRGNSLYTSERLQALWAFGFSSVAAATFETSAYVARYILKKQTGPRADLSHYVVQHPVSRQWVVQTPEFFQASHGIGAQWLHKFHKDAYPSDEIVIRGKKMKPPLYYDRIFSELSPKEFRRVSAKRHQAARRARPDNTSSRHRVREEVQKAAITQLKRNLG